MTTHQEDLMIELFKKIEQILNAILDELKIIRNNP
jgi:hypothetical protein